MCQSSHNASVGWIMCPYPFFGKLYMFLMLKWLIVLLAYSRGNSVSSAWYWQRRLGVWFHVHSFIAWSWVRLLFQFPHEWIRLVCHRVDLSMVLVSFAHYLNFNQIYASVSSWVKGDKLYRWPQSTTLVIILMISNGFRFHCQHWKK